MKKVLIIGVICVSLGILTTVAGAVTIFSGGTDQFTAIINKTLDVLPEFSFEINSRRDYNSYTETVALNEVKQISLQVDAAEIELRVSSDEQVSITVESDYGSRRGEISQTDRQIKFRMSRGKIWQKKCRISVSIPAQFLADAEASIRIESNSCKITSKSIGFAGDIILSGSAVDAELLGLLGGLEADITAGELKAGFSALSRDIVVHGTALDADIYIPANADATVSFSGTASDFEDEFGLDRSGGQIGRGGTAIDIRGTALDVELKSAAATVTGNTE